MTTLGSVALAGPLLSACGGPSTQSPSLTTVKLTQAVNSLAYAQNYIAKAKGYYAEHGLSVETIVTDGGGPDVQAVLAGNAQFTINDGAQVLTSFKQDRRLVAVAALFGRCLVNATISTEAATDLGITESSTFEQRSAALKGLRIGVTAPGALTWQIARYNLINAGIDPDKGAKLVALGAGASVLAALENRQVDVIYISVPFGEAAVARRTGVTLIDHTAGQDPNLRDFMMEGLWVTPDTLEKDSQTVKAMVAALTRASDFLRNSPPEEVVKTLQKDFPKFPADVLKSAAEKLRTAVVTEGRWDARAAETTKNVLSKNGLLPSPAPADDQLFEDRYL